jgi:hypothetical protein
MNHVLSWPHTPIYPGLLRPLKTGRWETQVTDKGEVHFDLPLGPVSMRFPEHEQPVPPGTPVYVWWKHGGFVCAPVAEVEAEEAQARSIADRVLAARERLQAARRERIAGDSDLAPLDEALPPRPPVDFPLLQVGR